MPRGPLHGPTPPAIVDTFRARVLRSVMDQPKPKGARKIILRAARLTPWYEANAPRFGMLAEAVRTVLTGILIAENIPFAQITTRTKKLKSAIDKCADKRYTTFAELTDMVGVRAIFYRLSDVTRAGEVIKREFREHPKLSVDKKKNLEHDQSGYLSVHYTCDLGEKRAGLLEYRSFADVLFELQLRTVLQHAWAELDHDKIYKGRKDLPKELKRDFYGVARVLEQQDGILDALVEKIEAHDREARNKVAAGDLTGPLEVASVRQLLKDLTESYVDLVPVQTWPSLPDAEPIALAELRRFGIKTLPQLAKLIDDDFLKTWLNEPGDEDRNWIGVVRSAMMHRDPERYFQKAFKRGTWHGLDLDSVIRLHDRFGMDRIHKLLTDHGIGVDDDEDDDDPQNHPEPERDDNDREYEWHHRHDHDDPSPENWVPEDE